MDCEIFKFSVLKKTHRVAKKKLYTEHVTPIYGQIQRFLS